jgi:hypothetical protein
LSVFEKQPLELSRYDRYRGLKNGKMGMGESGQQLDVPGSRQGAAGMTRSLLGKEVLFHPRLLMVRV